VSGWIQISGVVHALPARRGDEEGSLLWINAGELREQVAAEVFLPAVAPDRLDGAMGVGVGMLHDRDGEHSASLRLEFGRVRESDGVVSISGGGVDADVRFTLDHNPPSGGYCARCGSKLEMPVISVITPPDGGVIAEASGICRECDA
jgi:hypothetical protein